MSRAITDTFLNALKSGCLAKLAERIRNDDTLMLALRGNYVNVYYRGGSILNISEQSGRYSAWFDKNYSKDNTPVPALPSISVDDDCASWVVALPRLKELMNSYFARKRKSEREFQQLVAWENNRSIIAGHTEYFITDIEFADADQSARLDMLGLKWLSTHRKDETTCRPVFIEMKYGIGAYDGDAGIVKHIDDLNDILSDSEKCARLNRTIEDQFDQLLQLDLVQFNKTITFKRATVSGRPEVVFLLANHNPRSKKLLNVLSGVDDPPHFDLRFFTASFAGYGMHDACMLRLSDFKELLEKQSS
ncbi:hypothetical protein ACVWWO_004919 [Bradyrhizobium sp. F1.13.1]